MVAGRLPTAAEQHAIDRSGWVACRAALRATAPDEAAAWLRRHADPSAVAPGLEPELEHESVRKLRRLFWVDPVFWARWIVTSGLARLVEGFLGSSAGLVFHAAFLKPARVGGAVGPHQDQGLWAAELPGAVSAWMPLGVTSPDNGSLYVWPGSHRLGLIRHGRGPDDEWHDVVDVTRLEGAPVDVCPAPGDVVVWHRYLVHGSRANAAEVARPAMVLVFSPSASEVAGRTVDLTPLSDIYAKGGVE